MTELKLMSLCPLCDLSHFISLLHESEIVQRSNLILSSSENLNSVVRAAVQLLSQLSGGRSRKLRTKSRLPHLLKCLNDPRRHRRRELNLMSGGDAQYL